MTNARALEKRRRSITSIRKITRTMELIATAKYQQAMSRAVAVSDYTKRMTQLVGDLMRSGTEFSHPLLMPREETNRAALLVLSANRGMCGGFNGSVFRQAIARYDELNDEVDGLRLEASGKRGIAALRFRGIDIDEAYTQFEDKPMFDEVDELATRYLDEYAAGKLDRLDVVYTQFLSHSKQEAVAETLLPLGSLSDEEEETTDAGDSMYEFLPSVESIVEEVVPASFKVKLFKCFLDSAVSEQIARMIAMKAATENADEMIKHLSMTYNRARQTQITGEILEVIGGVEALN